MVFSFDTIPLGSSLRRNFTFSVAFSLTRLHLFSFFILLGLGLDDILKPDLIMPLIETLSLEERLASYLPEVYNSCIVSVFFLYFMFSKFEVIGVSGSMDA